MKHVMPRLYDVWFVVGEHVLIVSREYYISEEIAVRAARQTVKMTVPEIEATQLQLHRVVEVETKPLIP